MRRARLLLALIGLGLCAPAQPLVAAEPNWLRTACADGSAYYAFGACAGYLVAVVEASPGRYCPPEDADYQAIGLAVHEALAELPGREGESSAHTADRVLGMLYPC